MKVTNAASVCSTEDFDYSVNANAVVKAGGDCKDYPCKTNEVPRAPIFELAPTPLPLPASACTIRINENGEKVIPRGGFGPPKLSQEYTKMPNVDVCYNLGSKRWQINIEPSNKILINWYMGYCLDNIKQFEKYPIFNIDAVDTINIEHISIAYESFEKQRKYSGGGDYYIFEATQQHENKHELDFIYEITKLLQNEEFSYSRNFLSFSPACSDQTNRNQVLKNAKEHVNKLRLQFATTLKVNWELRSANPNYEMETQNSEAVQKIISDYELRLSL
jgi:hypothetical protein